MKLHHYILHNMRSIPDIIKSAFYCPALPRSPASLQIIQQPKDGTIKAGTTPGLTFSVEVNRKDVSYQWQFVNEANPEWVNSLAPNAKTQSITIGAEPGRNGQKYRCKITAADGSVVYSNAATMTVV